MVELISVSKTYENKNGKVVKALRNFNLKIDSNKFIIINGKSGSGKTTLLNIIGLIDKSYLGDLIIDGTSVSNKDNNFLEKFRRDNISIIFQENNLFDHMTVKENLQLSGNILGLKEEEYTPHIFNLLKYFNAEELLNQKVNELSAGQKQRVAIARSLMKNPKVLLADEPTGNLDQKTAESVMDYLLEVSKKCTVIMVSHNEELTKKYADIIIEIDDGTISRETINSRNYKNSFLNAFVTHGTDEFLIDENELLNTLKEKYTENKNNEFIIQLIEKVDYNNKIEEMHLPEIKSINRYIGLSFKDSVNFVFNILSRQKIKFVFTIILLTMTTVLLMLTSNIMSYDSNKVKANNVLQDQENQYIFFEETSYTNLFFEEKNSKLFSGNLFYNKLAETFSSENIFPVIENVVVSNKNGFAETVNLVIYNEINSSSSNSINKVIITDFMSDYLKVNQEDTINIFGKEYIVTEVRKTDYEKNNIKMKMLLNQLTEEDLYLINYKYKVFYINELEVKNTDSSKLYIRGSNFFDTKTIENYVDRGLYISNLKNKELILIDGVLPSNEDEIIISKSMLEYNGYSKIEEIGANLFFLNIHDKKYNNFYDDLLNLSDYYPEGLKVVGIYNDLDDVNILINEIVYQKIVHDYLKYYIYDKYIILNDIYSKYQLFNKISNKNMNWFHPFSESIDLFNEELLSISKITTIILLLLVIITVSIIISLMRQSIFDSKKSIGILRTLGTKQIDIYRIFISESTIVFICTIIFSTILYFVLMNTVLKNYFFKTPRLIVFDFKAYLITLVLISFSIILTISVTINKVSKINIIDSIRN